MAQILVVDDSASVRESARMILAPTWGFEAATLGDDVRAILARDPAELLIFGLSLPLDRPFRVLREILLADAHVRVLILADPTLLHAAQRIFNYRIQAILPKPFDIHELRRHVAEILSGFDRLPTLLEEMERAELEAAPSPADAALLLPPALRLFAARAAATTAHMVIEGERGTGKSAIAQLVHRESPWRQAPYLRMDARSLDEERLAMALRHLAQRAGEERKATLCFEEVGQLAQDLQLALRDLTEGVHPPGTPSPVRRMSLRVLATTTEPLIDLAARRTFREDLRQALSVLILRVPPLRERIDELDGLAQAFANDWAKRYVRESARFSQEALERLRNYLWPGNLRELRAVVGRALALTDGEEITAQAIVFVDESGPMLREGTSERAAGTDGRPEAAQAPSRSEDEILDIPLTPLSEGPEAQAAPSDGAIKEPPSVPPLDLLVHLLSHEIKNPLLAIKTFTQLIRTKFDDPDFRETFYNLVSSDVDRIDALVDAASVYASLSDGRPTRIDLNALIDQVLKGYEHIFHRKRIVVLRESEEPVPDVLADYASVAFALRCIISKAADAIPEGGDIHFMISAASGTENGRRRVRLDIRFANLESLLTRVSAILSGGEAAESTPGSIEITLAEQVLARQGGTLQVGAEGAHGARVTITLPAAGEPSEC